MKRPALLVVLALSAVAVLLVTPFVGIEQIGPDTLWSGDDAGKLAIFYKIRVPRVAAAFLAGAALATAGMAFQAMFRNPLATPFTLGVSSGAALGAALGIYLGATFSLIGIPGTSWAALAGALAAIGLVYGLTRTRQGFSAATLLLAGVAVSFFFSSLVLFLQYVSNPMETLAMLRWVMGGLDRIVGFGDVLSILPFAVAGSLVLLYLTHELNLITTGDDLAAARGVEVDRAKLTVFLTGSLMVGAVVAVCGPIGFVGLMAPHICRLLVGPDHRWLTPATLLFGGSFLVLCDTLARTAMAPTELPVGIITAILGGPFFLWLLLGRRRWGAMA